MKTALIITTSLVLAGVLPAIAAEGTKQSEKIVVEGRRIVELADGGSIVVDKAGTTYHVDAKGKRVRMKDGVVMEGKDGIRYLHKNDAIWRQITQKGTLAPNR
jgi:hypothetical protein